MKNINPIDLQNRKLSQIDKTEFYFEAYKTVEIF